MFEELITQLDEMGIGYTEDYETGSLVIDIADIDKATLIEVIITLSGYDLPFDINETSITVTGLETEAPTDMPEEGTTDETDYADEALNSLGMF